MCYRKDLARTSN
ncbi:hypothetical protein F383_07920 [Gossypium arboreum]|uniref:Uncharacterized protein n=1 Tax=Gossypium arboreum TaxID=29729 RepID=A0A0B0PB81_GOSAR|nr:hypothetical protein F383_06426 [Gossypium arboreum]KHG20546.1 hypothetical protein F383_07920 [Gossypium arboreum]